jgi:hypothetical protein
MIRKAYKNKVMGHNAVYKLIGHFKEGQQSLEDDSQNGRQLVTCNEETNDHVWEVT